MHDVLGGVSVREGERDDIFHDMFDNSTIKPLLQHGTDDRHQEHQVCVCVLVLT